MRTEEAEKPEPKVKPEIGSSSNKILKLAPLSSFIPGAGFSKLIFSEFPVNTSSEILLNHKSLRITFH